MTDVYAAPFAELPVVELPIDSERSRHDFLAREWRRYPAFESKFALSGRVRALDATTVTVAVQHPVSTVVSAEVSALCWAPEGVQSLQSLVAPAAVLKVGDWIGLTADQSEVILFAPCLEQARGHEVLAMANAWEEFQIGVRDFFRSRGFVEMSTPSLAVSPGTEPYLDPLKLELEWQGGGLTRYLITSPEFHLKKALAAGVPKLFEIARCFRNKEGGEHHRIEFTMLEWYRSFSDLTDIADDVETLIQKFRPEAKLVRVTMSDLFRQVFSFELWPTTSAEDLHRLAQAAGVRTLENEGFSDVFHRLFLERIEPQIEIISRGQPLLLSGYPPSMAALSRIGKTGFADRFEIYWSGLELANAFHELNDPDENRRRFANDNRDKQESGRETVPVDCDLLACLDSGMPPAAGIALGLERLFMALHGLQDIAMVRPFLVETRLRSSE